MNTSPSLLSDRSLHHLVSTSVPENAITGHSSPSRQYLRWGWAAFLMGTLLVAAALPSATLAQIQDQQKIGDGVGGFTGTIEDDDQFGSATASLGDLNGDGQEKLAVGMAKDDDGNSVAGAVWILSLNADGTVSSEQKISNEAGGFEGSLRGGDRFGSAVAPIGDLNDDGVPDLAVGADETDDGGVEQGAVWVLFLNADGTVSGEQKIGNADGGFGGSLSDDDFFGGSVANAGDVDEDGTTDLAVGASGDGGFFGGGNGAVWILFLNADGTVSGEQKINDTSGGFEGTIDSDDFFGSGISSTEDMNGDGVPDLAVGSQRDNDGGEERGAVWILFLNADGTVSSEQKISDTTGDFAGDLDNNDSFGVSVASTGDLNGNGTTELVVGANADDDGGPDNGAIWMLYLNADGTVASEQKISATSGGFGGSLNGDAFGHSVATVGDLDANGVLDLTVGAIFDDGNGSLRGAVWVLFGEQSLLPVEMAGLSAEGSGNAAHLTWQTASETNNAGFEVQRKAGSGTDWQQVGFVESKAEGGTTTKTQSYSFAAKNLSVGTHQFRLKQVDLDGGSALTDPVAVNIQMQEAVALTAPTPNPVSQSATLSFAVKERAKTTLQLYNSLGQQVATLYEGTPQAGEQQSARLDAARLPSGAYFLRLQAGDSATTRQITVVK